MKRAFEVWLTVIAVLIRVVGNIAFIGSVATSGMLVITVAVLGFWHVKTGLPVAANQPSLSDFAIAAMQLVLTLLGIALVSIPTVYVGYIVWTWAGRRVNDTFGPPFPQRKDAG